jgi:hypothetical protein
MNYKEALLKILSCIEYTEGSICENEWEAYGINTLEKIEILGELENYEITMFSGLSHKA